jgi:Flp pilus assembly protein TadD
MPSKSLPGLCDTALILSRSTGKRPTSTQDDEGIGLRGTGDPQKAIAEYRKAVELSGGDSDTRAALAHAYVAAGRRTEAEAILREMLRASQTGYVAPYI